MIKSEGYRVIHEATKYKKESVLETESICPVCGKTNGALIKEEHPERNRIRNRYTCRECGTIWKGNIYTDGWDKTTPAQSIKDNAGTIAIIAYVLISAIVGGISFGCLFVAVGAQIFLINVWLIARLVELRITGETRATAIFRNAVFMGLAVNIFLNPLYLLLWSVHI